MLKTAEGGEGVADKRIPWRSQKFTPDMVSGLIPEGMNEFMYPDYPDLPYPDGTNITWHRDPLVSDEEQDPYRDNTWPPSEDPWVFPPEPQQPPVR